MESSRGLGIFSIPHLRWDTGDILVKIKERRKTLLPCRGTEGGWSTTWIAFRAALIYTNKKRGVRRP